MLCFNNILIKIKIKIKIEIVYSITKYLLLKHDAVSWNRLPKYVDKRVFDFKMLCIIT
jgi:hypothetical protein